MELACLRRCITLALLLKFAIHQNQYLYVYRCIFKTQMCERTRTDKGDLLYSACGQFYFS